MGRLRPWARYGLLLVAHLLALGLGAAVLRALEGPPALRLQAELRAALAAFQAEFGACLPPGALQELLDTALRAQAHGVSNPGNASEASNWDLPSALLFAASILTTTGYGHMAPLSAGGKAFCVAYAALGLPASLALVAALRCCLLPRLSRLAAWVTRPWQPAPARAALLQAAALGLLVAAAFVLLPALVLWALRGDCSLLEALYLCFGSLSTIGLGDLLPGGGRSLPPLIYHLGQLALLGESRGGRGNLDCGSHNLPELGFAGVRPRPLPRCRRGSPGGPLGSTTRCQVGPRPRGARRSSAAPWQPLLPRLLAPGTPGHAAGRGDLLRAAPGPCHGEVLRVQWALDG
nr:potassium channel subfamily K member 7 isoform X1 [Oryctolagus cuniculus]